MKEKTLTTQFNVLFYTMVFVFVFGSACGILNKTKRSEVNDLYEKNILDGFAAKTGFEIVSLNDAPFKITGENSGPNSPVYKESITYLLDPQVDAYKFDEEGLGHIKKATLGWKESRETSPFVFDLFLHGDLKSENQLAIRIADLDIRKFLHQSIVPLSGDRNLARLQAHFAEFSRKAKILYALSDSEKLSSKSPYEKHLLDELHTGLSKLVNRSEEEKSRDLEPLKRALREFENKEKPKLDVVNRNLQEAIKSSDRKNELSKLNKTVVALNVVERMYDIMLINNCREPGNYEVKVRDRLGRFLLKTNFSFTTKLYNEILTRYHGLGIRQQGTGIRVPKTIRNREKLRYWDSFLPWNWMKSFPRATMESLSFVRALNAENFSKKASLRGEIQAVRGRIPYEEYEVEVRKKSGLRSHGPEPLSYVRADPKLSPPSGFESPFDIQDTGYWNRKSNAGKIVPHRFQRFEDLQQYEVFLSGFDLNGVYLGKSDLEKFDRERKEGRWHFNFSYLKNLDRFEIRQLGNEYLEIRLLSEPEKPESVNFIFGNFQIDVGQSKEFIFGIGTQPLISAYNDNVYQEPLLYGLAYDSKGRILDHHDQGIGVERVYIERLQTDSYKIRLISYERIIPVWEGIIRIPGGSGSDHTNLLKHDFSLPIYRYFQALNGSF